MDGVWTSINVIISYLTQTYSIHKLILFCKVVMIVTIQAKDGFYRNWYPVNLFFVIPIEIFECMQCKQFFSLMC